MDELPPWVYLVAENPVLRSVVGEMFKNPQFADSLREHFEERPGRPQFSTWFGDPAWVESMPHLKGQAEMDPRAAAVSLYNGAGKRGPVNGGAVVVDVDRIHAAVEQDSARARGLVKEAVLHEFGHLIPVAEARDMSARTGDPKPGSKNQAKHPVMQGENKLRGLFNLPAKVTYGLLSR